MKLRQRIAGSRCGTTVPGAKTKQETTRENDLGRIGKDEVGGSNPPSSSRKSSLFFWKGWIFLVFQHFSRCFGFLNLDLTTQTATDREKRLTERISHSVSRRFLSACFQTHSFSGDFRFHFYDHLCYEYYHPERDVVQSGPAAFSGWLEHEDYRPYRTEVQLYKSLLFLKRSIDRDLIVTSQREALQTLRCIISNLEYRFYKAYGMEIEDKRTVYGECTYHLVPREDEPSVCLMHDWIYLPSA